MNPLLWDTWASVGGSSLDSGAAKGTFKATSQFTLRTVAAGSSPEVDLLRQSARTIRRPLTCVDNLQELCPGSQMRTLTWRGPSLTRAGADGRTRRGIAKRGSQSPTKAPLTQPCQVSWPVPGQRKSVSFHAPWMAGQGRSAQADLFAARSLVHPKTCPSKSRCGELSSLSTLFLPSSRPDFSFVPQPHHQLLTSCVRKQSAHETIKQQATQVSLACSSASLPGVCSAVIP